MSSSTSHLSQQERLEKVGSGRQRFVPARKRLRRLSDSIDADVDIDVLDEPTVKKCRIENDSKRPASPAKQSSASYVGLHSLVATLLETGKWSDLIIKCRDKEWKVHRVVICLPSKVLSAMVDSGFLEGKTGIIDLSDSEPDIVDCMIRFLYTNDYPYSEKSETVPIVSIGFVNQIYSGQNLVINTKVYALAEYLDLPALKKTAAAKFACHLAKEGVSTGFTESLRIMYSETPESDRELKDLAVEYAIKHAATFLEREEFAAFCKGKESGEFTFEMLKATSDKAAKKKTPVKTRLN